MIVVRRAAILRNAAQFGWTPETLKTIGTNDFAMIMAFDRVAKRHEAPKLE